MRLFSVLCVFTGALFYLTGGVFAQSELVYEQSDPGLGFNIVSYHDDRPDEWIDYRTAVVELEEVGADHVNFVVFRRVDEAGRIDRDSGPELGTIAYAVRLAKRKNLKVTVTPIFETESGWRGAWDPTGAPLRTFRASYARFVLQLASLSELGNGDVLNIGSELSAFVNRRANRGYLKNLIAKVRRRFSGEIGYNANWDNYNSLSVKERLWDHPEINHISVSLYPHLTLASFEEADASDVDPELFATMVQLRWEEIIDELKAYASSLDGGNGMPVVVGEFGAVPFNRAASTPWSHIPSEESDPAEQEAVIMGLIRAMNHRAEDFPKITLWQWGIGDHQDNYGINPFVPTEQQSTALKVVDFLQSQHDVWCE